MTPPMSPQNTETDDDAEEQAPDDEVQEDDAHTSENDATATDSEGDTTEEQQEAEQDDDPDAEDHFSSGGDSDKRQDADFIIEAGALEAYWDALKVFVDEAKVHLTFDGWASRAVDPANVGMVDVHLDDTAFESFDVKDDGVIGLNINRAMAVLDGAEPDDPVEVHLDATTRNIVVRYNGHEFTIALIDPESIRTEPDLPNLDLPVTGRWDNEKMQLSAGFADNVSDHIKIATPADYEGLVVSAQGDTDSYEGGFNRGEDVWFDSRPLDESNSSLFSNDYLKPAIGALGDQRVEFELGSEFPIKMHGDLGDEDDELGDVTYMVAPRIQSN